MTDNRYCDSNTALYNKSNKSMKSVEARGKYIKLVCLQFLNEYQSDLELNINEDFTNPDIFQSVHEVVSLELIKICEALFYKSMEGRKQLQLSLLPITKVRNALLHYIFLCLIVLMNI